MLKKRIVFALWIILICTLIFLTGNTFSIFLLVCTVLSFAISLIGVILQRNKLISELVLPNTIGKGKKRNGKVIVRNSSILPVLFGYVAIVMENTLTKDKKRISIDFTVSSKSESSSEFEFGSYHCGLLRIKVESVSLTDIFGIISIKTNTAYSDDVLSIPLDYNSEGSRQLYNMNVDFGRDKGMDKSGAIDYTFDMPIKDINWKLSAKFDDYLAYAHEKQGVVFSSIFIETSINEELKNKFAEITDERIEMAYNLSTYMCKCGIYHKIVFYSLADKCYKNIPIYSVDDLSQTLAILLSLEFVCKDQPSSIDYKMRDSENLNATAYIIDSLSYNQEDLSGGEWIVPIYQK